MCQHLRHWKQALPPAFQARKATTRPGGSFMEPPGFGVGASIEGDTGDTVSGSVRTLQRRRIAQPWMGRVTHIRLAENPHACQDIVAVFVHAWDDTAARTV